MVRRYGHGLIEKIIARKSGDLASTILPRLPLPALGLLPEKTQVAYRRASESKYPIVGHGFGCLWQCNYCSAKMDTPWTQRLIDNARLEVEQARKHGYTRLWCVDNLLLVDSVATLRFDACVAKYNMTWSGMTRPELITKRGKELNQLQSCSSLAMGVESYSLQQLKKFRRGVRLDHFDTQVRAFHLVREAGIETVAFVILDLPGSTKADFEALLEHLDRLDPSTVSWSFYNPPATTLLEDQKHNLTDFGFYRWPMGYSQIPKKRVVQQAMVLAGKYWRGWQPCSKHCFFTTPHVFGVRFKEGTIHQQHQARSPIGNVWEIWSETT